MPERPDFIRHWSELEGPDDSHYPGDEELMSIGAPIARLLGLIRIGIHHERLPPGRRTSYPHAESAEEEFVYVLQGEVVLRSDGGEQLLSAGMCAGFPAGSSDGHQLINRSAAPAVYLEVSNRDGDDCVYYSDPDVDLMYVGNKAFRRDGTPC